MKVLEIPAYRKNQLAQNATAGTASSSRLPEIPAFKSRNSNDWQPTPIDNSNQEFQQMQLPSAVNSDLLRRLKSSDAAAHVRRSIDCIAAQAKASDGSASAAEATPTGTSSWSNVAQRSESLTSNSGVGVGSSKKSSIDDETKGESTLYSLQSYRAHTYIPTSVKHTLHFLFASQITNDGHVEYTK